jgi:hypothetical protein
MERVVRHVADVQSAQSRAFGSNLLRPWLVANIAGVTIGAAAWGGVWRALSEPYFGADISTLEAARIQATTMGLSAAVFAALVGTAQWLVLRQVVRAGWWIPATCVCWAIGGVVSGFGSGGATSTIGPDAGPLPPLAHLVVLPLNILLMGSGQWLILHREFRAAGWWPFVNVGALVAGGSIGLAVATRVPWFAPTDFPSAPALAVVGAVCGPIYAGLTWAFLTQLRRREP